ncbi:MAG: condensation domain-containing protein, partial [Acidobacteriaceae bacterium]
MAASAGFFLSPQQKSIWTAASSARSQIAVLIAGEFDESRLHAALREVVQANEALRTVFQRQTGMKMPFQVVLDACEPVWSSVALGQSATDIAQELMEKEAREQMPADASQLRSALFTCADARTLWVLTAHSAVADAPSMRLLLAETLRSYAGAVAAEEESLRYVQFSQWQNDLLAEQDDAAKDAGKYWSAQDAVAPSIVGAKFVSVASCPASQLAIDFDGDPGKIAASIGGDATASDVVLAAWSAVVARWCGQQSIQMGVVLEGREYDELAGLIGAIAKMVPLVATLKGQPTFAEMVSQVHAQRDEMASVQEYYSFEKTFKVGYEHGVLGEPVAVAGATFSPLFLRDSALDCALKLNAQSTPEGTRIELQYQPHIIGDEVAAEIADSVRSFLSEALAAPQQSVSTLPIVSAARKQQIVTDWNSTSVAVVSGGIHSLISAQGLRSPGAEAVRSGGEVLTYAELDARANRLAHWLVKLGVRRGSLVGLCVSRSAEMMVAVLAILKAG